MHDETFGRTVSSLRRRIAGAAYLGELARHGAGALVVAGAAALLMRLFLGWSALRALGAFALLAPAAASAWWFARRRFVRAETVAAWIDVELAAGGRVVTAFELGTTLSGLAIDLARASALRLRWRLLLRPVIPALAFAALAVWIPVHRGVLGASLPAVPMRPIERLAEKLAALEETVELDAELRAELRERLEHAREQADAAPLSSTWESLDQIAQRMAEEAERARERIDEARVQLSSQPFGEARRDDAQDARQQLAQTLEQMAADGLATNLPKSLAEALTEAGLPEASSAGLALLEGAPLEAAQLANLSKEMLGALDGKLAKLLESGLIDPAKLRPFDVSVKLHECTEKCEGGG